MRKSLRLSHAVLASSIFIGQYALADTTITGLNSPAAGASPPYLTSVAGNIVINPTGKIQNAAGNGINIDSASAVVALASNNTNGGGVGIQAINGYGIQILAAGTSAVITNGSGTAIVSTTSLHAIDIGADLTTITNNGIILGAQDGIHVNATGTNAVIYNIGGTIQSGTGASSSVFIAPGSSGLSLTNSMNGASPGQIIATGAGANAITANGDFASITNGAGSTISAVNGNGIILGGATKGDIFNSGTISINPFIALNVSALYINAGAYTGSINNLSTGIIQNLALDSTPAVTIEGSFGAFNNAGIIQGVSGTTDAIDINNVNTGTFINTGTIKADQSSTIIFGANSGITGFVNSGTISAANAPVATINAIAANVNIPNGIINSDIIIDNGLGPIALNLSGAGNIIPLFQIGGSIIGDVFLAGGGGNALNMSGGIINGDVSSSATASSTLNISGGSFTPTSSLNIDFNGNTINLSGGSLQDINSIGTGNNIYNVTGGTFTQLNGTFGDELKVNGTYTLTGTVANVPTISVNGAGTTFTVNNTISGITNQILINANTTMVANAGVGGISGTGALNILNGGTMQINNGSTVDMGSATNAGTLSISDNASLNLNPGGYSQIGTGIFAPTILNTTATGFGTIFATGAVNLANTSTIRPQLSPSGTFIPDGATFDIIQTVGAVADNSTIVQPTSAIISFTKNTKSGADCDNGGNCVELIAHRNPLALVALPDIPLAIAASLDPIVGTTTNPELIALFGQLQLLPDIQSVSNALLQLAPGFNNALPVSSRISMDNAFSSVHARLEAMSKIDVISQDARYVTERDYELYNGVNYGDANVIGLTGQYGLWVKGDATLVDQHKRNYVEGFKAESTALAIGFDWRPTDFATVGIAQSFTKVNTKDYTDQQNQVNVDSLQTTIYSTFVPYENCQAFTTQTVYLETMAAIASHKYNTVRNIVINTLVAQSTADFYGWHYGVQSDLGYAFISSDNHLVAPFARFRYTYLDVGPYTETNAGGLSLSVKNEPVVETVAGLGVRLALKRDYIQAIYVPEFSFALLYDFNGQSQSMQSNFLGGGNPFYINSLKPAQYIQQYSAGITAYTSDGYSFTIKGDFEHREQYFGYHGYMQLKYAWD